MAEKDYTILTEKEQLILIEKYKNNSLLNLCPEIINEWDYKLNGDLRPNMVARFSNQKAWWHCSKNHKWYATISKRPEAGCPYCKRSRVIKGLNDLETCYPEIAKEWNYERNGEVLPSMVTKSSHEYVWWKCNLGHSYYTTVNRRTSSNNNCPYCANQRILIGFNDLEHCNPELASEWDYDKNGELLPSMVTKSSSKHVWWKCSLGHSWMTKVNQRTSLVRNCPYCMNKKILVGFNDLKTTHPEILDEWDYVKNEKLPSEYMSGTDQKVWWNCKKGHSYKMNIVHRVNGCGCSICKESKGEKAIRSYLDKNHIKYIAQYKTDDCKDKRLLPFDFAILNSKDEIDFLIEYDGVQHFECTDFSKSKKESKRKFEEVNRHDTIKNNYCKENNIKLLRIPYTEFDNIEKILNKEFNIT